MAEILVVDDEPSICDMLCFSLGKEGHRVRSAHDAGQAFDLIGESMPDVVLIDWMMPGMSGVELIHCLRSEPATRRLPIIMLTAKDNESDKIEGLVGGADDYILKPFSNRELSARIKALLRRSKPHKTQQKIKSGALTLDPQTQMVTIGGRNVAATRIQFRMLHFLVAHENQVFSRRQILDNVWGTDKFISERTIDVQIRRLRKMLAAHNRLGLEESIQTVRGIGYCYRSI